MFDVFLWYIVSYSIKESLVFGVVKDWYENNRIFTPHDSLYHYSFRYHIKCLWSGLYLELNKLVSFILRTNNPEN